MCTLQPYTYENKGDQNQKEKRGLKMSGKRSKKNWEAELFLTGPNFKFVKEQT
jgi:hypothetical protein